MTAIISTTYDDTYLFYLPITTWCWNKLGVDVICFVPDGYSTFKTNRELDKFSTAYYAAKKIAPSFRYEGFICPKHKEATYAQCSRLYGACLDLPEDEILISGDIDMLLFNLPPIHDTMFTVVGRDLTPEGQVPMCYLGGPAKEWREIFDIGGKGYQQCLDELLGSIECDNMRGNYWAKDQEQASFRLNEINKLGAPNPRNIKYVLRARPGTQFATNRIDRDDAYFIDRLTPEIIDYHCHRPGYTDENFEKILTVIKYFYPHDDLTWMRNYQEAYKKLL